MSVIQRDIFSNTTRPKQKPRGGPKTKNMDWEPDMKGRQQWSFLGTAFYKLSLNIGNLSQRREANLMTASLNSGYKSNRNRQYAAATGQLVLPFGRLQMAVGGKCLYFFKQWRWVWCALDFFFFIPLPHNRAVCHRLPGPLYHLPPSVGIGASCRSHLLHSV